MQALVNNQMWEAANQREKTSRVQMDIYDTV